MKLGNYKKPLILWGVITLFFAFQFILRLSVGILREDIIDKYHISTVMFGSLAGCYYLGYSIMQIPFGILLDRFNFRTVIIFAIIITIIGTLPFVFTENWYLILAGRFLIGAGSAAGFLTVTKVIKLFFKEEHHSLMIGFSFTLGLLGAVFGGKPMKIIFNYFGYESGFKFLILLSLIIAGIIFIIQDKKLARVEVQTIDNTPQAFEIFSLIFNPKILLIGIAGGLMVGSLEGFADVWAIPFFNQIYGIDLEDSILAASYIYVGMCIGGPILAYLVKYFNSLNFVILTTNILTVIIFLILFYFQSWNFYLLNALMLVLGILCCYQVLIFTKASSLVDKNVTGLAIAIINCLNMSFGYLFHFVISNLMQANILANEGGALKYNYFTFVLSLSVIPIGCLLGQLCFFCLSVKPKVHIAKA